MKRKPLTFGGRTLSRVQCAVIGAPFWYHDPDDGRLYPMDTVMITGRGWGKSTGALAKIWQYANLYPGSEIGIFRMTAKSLRGLKKTALELFMTEDQDLIYNKQEGLMTLSNGTQIIFDMLADLSMYMSQQGQNFQLIFIDEIEHWPDATLVDKLLSNLRGGVDGQPCVMIYGGNPGDKGHFWMVDRWVSENFPKIHMYRTANGRPTILFRGNWEDNCHPVTGKNYNGEDYPATLLKSTNDETLLKMWLSGDVRAVGGTFWSGYFDESNLIQWNENDHFSDDWRKYIALDHGTAKAACVLGMAEAKQTTHGPDSELYVEGDVVVAWEMTTQKGDDLRKGDGSTIAEICARTREVCDSWNWPRRGVGDSAVIARHGDANTLADTYEEHGLYIYPSQKGAREPQWDVMKTLFKQGAVNGSREFPSIYVNEHVCPYMTTTLRLITPDAKKFGDLDTNSFDDGCDALRYGVIGKPEGSATRVALQR